MSIEKTVNILVVDDEFSIRDSLKLFMEDFDYNVTTAESAEEALAFSKHMIFDLAIVDLRLPGISGDKLILKLKEFQSDIKFLIHTGSTEYKVSAQLENIGVHKAHILIKPIPDLRDLITKIEQTLNDSK